MKSFSLLNRTDCQADSAVAGFLLLWNLKKLVIPIFALATLVGCGDGRPTRVTVSGKVLIDGEPLPKGIIQFVSEGVRPAGGKLDGDGSFTLSCYEEGDGIIPGSYQVTVVAKEMISESKARWLAPSFYADYRQSGLRYEITEPIDDLTIELTWGGKKPPAR